MLKLIAAAATKAGKHRNNQDNFILGESYAPREHGAFTAESTAKARKPFFAAVCCGMGGEASGERASYEACVCLAELNDMLEKDAEEDNREAVEYTILSANRRLCEIMLNERCPRMGCTVAAALIQGESLYYTNLGDSRVYLLRGQKLRQLTLDHTEERSITGSGAPSADRRLSRHLGMFADELKLECPRYEDIGLEAGDRLLLCGYGVSCALEAPAIAALLSGPTSAAARALKFVDAARESGSADDLTAMVIDVEKAFSLFGK